MQRPWLLALALLAVPLAGCASPPPEPPPSAAPPSAPPPPPPLPEPISDSRQVQGGADPLNTFTGAPCGNADACFPYPFTLLANATIDASLTWTVPGSDFDLYLYNGTVEAGSVEVMSASPPPGTEEAIATELGTGEYTLVVVAWLVSQDTYTLEATFAQAE